MEETAAALNHVCQTCLSTEKNDADDDDHQHPHDPSCVLFGYDRLTPNAVHRHVGEWPVLDFIQTNMEEATSKFQDEDQSSIPLSYQENTVTIFLPCPTEDCHMGHSFYLADDTHDSQNTSHIYSSQPSTLDNKSHDSQHPQNHPPQQQQRIQQRLR